MNILFLATSLQDAQAGAAHHSIEFINALAQRSDVRLTVLATATSDRLHPAAATTVYRWPSPLKALWRVEEFWEVRRLARELSRQPLPPVDFCYTRSTPLGLAFRSLMPTVPIVSHIGSVIASRETIEETSGPDAQAWRTRFKARLSDRRERQSYSATRWLHLASTPIVGRSREVAHNLPHGFFHICPLGSSTVRFDRNKTYGDVRATLSIPDHATVFLSVARLVRWKNVDLVIRAMERLCDANSHLIVVGDGTELEELKRLAMTCGVAQRTHFVGHISDPAPYYSVSDVFVLPSQIESFGNVYAEAMLMGLPCIGMKHSPPTILSSAQDVIPDGVAGYCVSGLEELTHQMKTLACNKVLRRAVGESAYRHAVENYTIERYTKTVLQLMRVRFGTDVSRDPVLRPDSPASG